MLPPRSLRWCRRIFRNPEAQCHRLRSTCWANSYNIPSYIRWESSTSTKPSLTPETPSPVSAPQFSPRSELATLIEKETQKVKNFAEHLRNNPALQTQSYGYELTLAKGEKMHWRVALAVLEECIAQRLPISTKLTGIVMGFLTRAGQIEHAEALFEALIARRGGMRLTIGHARSLLKFYTMRLMKNDACRIYDVTCAFLHDTSKMHWLNYYMMLMYAELEEYDRFEAMFEQVRHLPEEREMQICHLAFLDTYMKKTSGEAVLRIYQQMIIDGLKPTAEIMRKLFQALAQFRDGEHAWEIYQRDFMKGIAKKRYSMKDWREVTKNLLIADVGLLRNVIQITPKSKLFRLLWVVDPSMVEIEDLIEHVSNIEGPNGPSRESILLACVGRAAYLGQWTSVVACWEALADGDSRTFPLYLRGLIETGRSSDVLKLFSDPRHGRKFMDPDALEIVLLALRRSNDAVGVADLVYVLLDWHAQGRGLSMRVFDLAIECFAELHPLPAIKELWQTLLLHHTDRISPATYLSIALGYARLGEATLACRFFVDALTTHSRFQVLRSDVRWVYDRFCSTGVFRPSPDVLRILDSGSGELQPNEIGELLARLSTDLDSQGVYIRTNQEISTPFAPEAPSGLAPILDPRLTQSQPQSLVQSP